MVVIMQKICSARRRALVRSVAMILIGFSVTACEAPGENPSGVVYLPDSTPRINARVAREAQLVSPTYRDDLPEYTGAPSPEGVWPARSATGQTIYRDEANLEVGSEGPYAEVGGPSDGG
jgi:hypothetical protein